MMRKLITWAARLAAVAVAGLAAVAIPAGAAHGTPAENPPNVVVTSYGCEVLVVFDNTGPYTDGIGHDGPWFVEFDYRLPGDVQLPLEPELEGLTIGDPPLAGQPFDGLHNPVPVEAGESVTLPLTVEPGTDQVEVRLVRGAEQRVFFDWRAYPIGTCPQPSPTPTPGPSPTPAATPSSEPSPAPTATPPASGQGGSGGDRLPTTGSSLPVLAGAGAGLAGLGTAALYVGRRRRRLFTGR